MPRIIPEEEYDKLLKILQSFSEGASISELLSRPEISYPKRTLQRRLDSMQASGQLVIRGKARALKYLVPENGSTSISDPLADKIAMEKTAFTSPHTPNIEPPIAASESPENKAEKIPLEISYSPEAESIRASVTRPMAHRQKVGHKLALLDYYQPNQSNYLNLALRQELAAIGRIGASHSPAGTYLRQNMDRFSLDMSWNSSRLEGNSYTLQEAQSLFLRGETAAGKSAEESQILLNHQATIEMMATQAGEISYDRHTICNLHGLLADNLLIDPAACGRLRHRELRMATTVYTPIQEAEKIESRFNQVLAKASAIEDPFEQAFFMMVHLPYLQPFEHLNNNVARLAANIPLIHFNLCPLSFADVPRDDYSEAMRGIYELNRVDYLRDLFVWAYQRSAAYYAVAREYLGDPDPFRLKYRAEVRELVRFVVSSGKNSSESGHLLRQEVTRKFDESLQSQFLNVVETELISLHQGNIARYQLSISDFDTWKSQGGGIRSSVEKDAADSDQLGFSW